MCDIKDFCPSIKEKLLWEAITFAKCYISITNKDIDFMEGNSLYITTTKRGSKKEKATLMLQWAYTMEQRYVN